MYISSKGWESIHVLDGSGRVILTYKWVTLIIFKIMSSFGQGAKWKHIFVGACWFI